MLRRFRRLLLLGGGMMNENRFDPLALETPYVFFTGKGGVGKTSVAAATAISLARAGKRVLIVSTDPASNLDDVFECKLGASPVGIPGVEGLFAADLDPVEAAGRYREKVVGPYRSILPDAALAQIEEQLSGACTVEIAAFDEFAKLLSGRDGEKRLDFDHVILDTAPTGHTLRLLQLPKAWSGFLEESTHGASCLGPLSGLGDKKDLYADTVSALADPFRTTIFLVARPDAAALSEAARASAELKELGIANQRLVVNGLLCGPGDDAAAQAFRGRQDRALSILPEVLKSLETGVVELQPRGLTGIAALGALFGEEGGKAGAVRERPSTGNAVETGIDLEAGTAAEAGAAVDALNAAEAADDAGTAANAGTASDAGSAAGAGISTHYGLLPILRKLEGKRTGVIMTMGKGGVGKTTVAAALALGLAERGRCVHLTTTDPADHLAFALGGSGSRAGLAVSRIDPKAASERYREEVLARSAPHLDEEGMALLREDLSSPCTEEIAVFQAFAEAVEKADDGFVVLDTAPTGHTLLLLDAAEAYHREVLRSAGDISESVGKLLPRLRSPEETDIVLVTLPEATPVLEAERLQEDLRRAGISPGWWVVNQSWQRVRTENPVLTGRAAAELPWIERVRRLAERLTLVSWQPEEPVGEERLLLLENG